MDSLNKQRNTSKYIQFSLAGIIVLILYIISLLVLNTDSLVVLVNSKVKQNEKISIFKGLQTVTQLSGIVLNTVNPFADNFLKISRSLNDKGGAQFTYQFWMKINDTNYQNYNDLTVLLKGDNTKYLKGLYDTTSGKLVPYNPQLYNQDPSYTSSQPEYIVKCPLIKFGKSYKNMIIEFNTNKDPNAKMEVLLEGSDQYKKNVLSLSPLNWYLITYVIEDNYSSAFNQVNGIQVTLYVNDFPYQVSSPATDPLLKNNFLKQNDGDLYLFPDVQVPREFMSISDMKYYNYALTQQSIAGIFTKGPSLYVDNSFNNMSDGKNKPAFLSAYNKIDVYNK